MGGWHLESWDFSCHRFTIPSRFLLLGFHVISFYMMNCINTHLIIKPAAQKSDGLTRLFQELILKQCRHDFGVVILLNERLQRLQRRMHLDVVPDCLTLVILI
ncbi:hypothetical protein AEAE_0925 [Aeriscardovia aeriphila]|uniref:Uncharacterized protein n=1 Tax=Aeriscardovia aeriphila TaxID=218139 RepID=A0A261FB99_9BIFI|nr:hypothetical protein AEAE_0925 [Aeriscardovia aeriphila]